MKKKWFEAENQILNINFSNLTLADVKNLNEFLKENPSIYSLVASECNLNDDMAKLLAQNKTLISLDLSHNSIGNDGAKAFAENENIEQLDLTSNTLGDQGVIHLANNKNLKDLNLNRNKLGEQSAEALAKNNTLQSLSIVDCFEDLDLFYRFDKNKTLVMFNIGQTVRDDFIVPPALCKFAEELMARNRNPVERAITAFFHESLSEKSYLKLLTLEMSTKILNFTTLPLKKLDLSKYGIVFNKQIGKFQLDYDTVSNLRSTGLFKNLNNNNNNKVTNHNNSKPDVENNNNNHHV